LLFITTSIAVLYILQTLFEKNSSRFIRIKPGFNELTY